MGHARLRVLACGVGESLLLHRAKLNTTSWPALEYDFEVASHQTRTQNANSHRSFIHSVRSATGPGTGRPLWRQDRNAPRSLGKDPQPAV